MLDRLPSELVALILEMASTDDRKTARSLCLVSQTVRRVAARVLYRHIFLSGTEQVRRFNTTLKTSPILGDLILGVTLHDESLQMLQSNFIYERQYEDDPDEEWIPAWKTLIRYLGVLSRAHNLATLVVTVGAYRRLSYHHNNGMQGGKMGQIEAQLRKSNLKLNHLAISHSDLLFTLQCFSMKRLTWFGCELMMSMNSLAIDEVRSIRSDDLQAVDFMLGQTFHQVGPIDNETSAVKGDIMHKCIPMLMGQLSMLSKVVAGTPELSVYLHRETQEGKMQTVQMLRSSADFKVNVGLWGNASDYNQRQADMENFASKGWLQRAPRGSNKKGKQPKVSAKGKSRAKGNQCRSKSYSLWCGCLDMELMSYLAGSEGGDED